MVPNRYTENEFTLRVREYLIEKYDKAYKAHFIYEAGNEDNPYLYTLQWVYQYQDKPMTILGEFNNEDQFFKYVCKEIDLRRFYLMQTYTLQRTDENGKT